MACLRISVTPAPHATLAVSAVGAASFGIESCPQAQLDVAATKQASLTVGEVCSVSSGVLVVLAGSDGPLRTRDGGYILLDPARE